MRSDDQTYFGMDRRDVLRLLAVLPLSGLLGAAGCGGGSRSDGGPSDSGAGAGRIAVTIRWPERITDSRLIPVAAQSIRLQVFSLQPVSETVIRETVAARPSEGTLSTTILLERLPSVRVRIAAAAFPNADGTGVAQATGNVDVIVEEEQTAGVALSLASTITEVRILSPVPDLAVETERTLSLQASAFNDRGELVLTAPDRWRWTVANPDIATLTPSGDRASVRGKTIGGTTVEVTELESNVSVLRPLTVTPVTVVAARIEPDAAAVTIGGSNSFSAVALGPDGEAVDVDPLTWQWSIADSSLASIVPNGASANVNGKAAGSTTVRVSHIPSGVGSDATLVVVTGGSCPEYFGSITFEVNDSPRTLSVERNPSGAVLSQGGCSARAEDVSLDVRAVDGGKDVSSGAAKALIEITLLVDAPSRPTETFSGRLRFSGKSTGIAPVKNEQGEQTGSTGTADLTVLGAGPRLRQVGLVSDVTLNESVEVEMFHGKTFRVTMEAGVVAATASAVTADLRFDGAEGLPSGVTVLPVFCD